MRTKKENIEKAYNKVIKELRSQLNDNELELNRIAINRIKWNIK